MTKESIFKKQKKILLFVNYYVRSMKNKINVANSSVCYFHNYGDYISSSYLKLKFLGKRYYGKFFFNFLKNLYSIINTQNYVCIKSKKQKKYKYLFISHVSRGDFQKNGSYKDNYFSLNSKDYKNTLFFLNSIDGYSPKSVQDNLIIFKRKSKNVSIVYLLKYFLKFIIDNKFSLQKLFHYFNFLTEFSNKIFPYLYETVLKNKFKKIIMFYEAQPYQNNFINELNKKKIRTEIIGYYHTALLPLHTSLVYRQGAPNKLFISGQIQKRYCEKNLGWPKNRIFNIDSFRYSKKKNLVPSNTIFLPYEISRSKIILQKLDFFFKKAKIKSLPFFNIRNHPAAKSSKKHLKLMRYIKKIISDNKEKFDKNSKKKTIFIGSTTSISLALEEKKEVIHICEDPIFDSFNQGIWKNIVVTKLDKFIFKYRLKKNTHILKLNKDNNNKVKKYLKINVQKNIRKK